MIRKAFTTVGFAAAAALIVASPVTGQDVERMPWGEPDISGYFTQSSIVPLERPRDLGTQEFYTPEESAARAEARLAPPEPDEEQERERGTTSDVHYDFDQFGLSQYQNEVAENLRTSIIVDPPDGRMPELVDAAIVRRDERNAERRGHEFDGPENRSLTERCIVWSSTLPPILPGGYNSNMQIFQSPGYVVIQSEMGDPRIVPTDGREHAAGDLQQWNGVSVGRWEGDTLVIESTNFHEETAWRSASKNLKVTERLRRIDDKTVEYGFTVEDPETWSAPWSGVYPLAAIDGPLFEYACHEGNYGIANILAGQRAEEARLAAEGAGGQDD
jgi:hypothetical protein